MGGNRAVVLLGGAMATLLLAAPGTASADYGCTFTSDPPATVTFTAGAEEYEATLVRSGDEIRFGDEEEVFEGSKGRPHPMHVFNAAKCPVTPTVHNVYAISVALTQDSTDEQNLIVSLAGGPFAPGASAEPDGSPEVEISVLSSPNENIEFDGTPGDDVIRFGVKDKIHGVNLNPAIESTPDIDVTLPVRPSTDAEANRDSALYPLAFAGGGAGNDSITTAGGPEFDGGFGTAAFLGGGQGNDTLFGEGSQFSFMFGGAGADRMATGFGPGVLLGGRGNDTIVGSSFADNVILGAGRDYADLGGGADKIDSVDRGRPDTVLCGPKRDVVYRDPRDHLRGCEKRRSGHAHFSFFD